MDIYNNMAICLGGTMNKNDSDNTVRWVCNQCGLAGNALTCLLKYGGLPNLPSMSASTFHIGYCEVCGRKTQVTEPRDYFYPDFDLISDYFIKELGKED